MLLKMKKIIVLSIFLVCVFIIQAQVQIGITLTNLNLRDEPNATSRIITVIPKGVGVTFEDNCRGKWGYVSYNGNIGYVNSGYLKITTIDKYIEKKSDTNIEHSSDDSPNAKKVSKDEINNSNSNDTGEKTAKNFYNLLIGILIPIAIFVLGLIYGYIKEKINKRKETKDFRDVVFYWVDTCQKSLKEQCDKFVLLAEKVKTSNDINPERLEYYAMSIYRLNQIPIEKYISIFAINSKRIDSQSSDEETKKVIYKLVSCLEFIVRAENAIKEQYEEYRSAYENLLKGTNSAYLELVEVSKAADLNKKLLQK